MDQFKNIICLNLESRPDRKAEAKAEFKKVGISKRVEFFPAFPGGYPGFNKSQYEIFRTYDKGGDLFVFEDDVLFINDYENLNDYLKELPEEWDIISLGANLRSRIQRVTPRLFRLNNAWTTHAIGYSENMVKWIRHHYDGKSIYDEWLRVHVQPVKNCYITYPMLATQRPGYSNIMKRDTDYGIIEASQANYLI